MKRLEYLRRNAELSQQKLGNKCNPPVDQRYISNAERRGMVLYPSQAQRIADALGWDGDPLALFEDMEA